MATTDGVQIGWSNKSRYGLRAVAGDWVSLNTRSRKREKKTVEKIQMRFELSDVIENPWAVREH